MAPKTGKSEFDAFVKDQQPTEDVSMDWAHERDEWLGRLGELYATVQALLRDYLDGGSILVSFRDIPLNEENIGAYSAQQMTLKIGRKEIDLIPVGTLLIGTKGRVDIVGPAGRSRFVLVDKDASRPNIQIRVSVIGRGQPVQTPKLPEKTREIVWTWKLATAAPTIRYIELTEDSLYQTLMEVGNG